MSKKGILLVTLFAFLVFAVAGCGVLDKLLSIKEDFNKEEPKAEEEKKEGEVGEIVVEAPDIGNEVTNEQPVEFKTIQLFFGAPDGMHLVAIEKEVPKSVGIARETISALLQGPDFQSGLLPTIPAGTELLDINVKEDGLCIVDFSKELISNLSGGETNEKLAVYSITNTLCQFPTVDKVEFRVEGQSIDTLLGHIQLEPALAANADLVQEIK